MVVIGLNIIMLFVVFFEFQNYDEAIANNATEAKVILKTEPDLEHLIDQL